MHGGAPLFLESPPDFAARLRRLASLLEASGLSRPFLAALVARSAPVATGDPDATAARLSGLRAVFAPHGDAPAPRQRPTGIDEVAAAAVASVWEPGLAFAGLAVPNAPRGSAMDAATAGSNVVDATASARAQEAVPVRVPAEEHAQSSPARQGGSGVSSSVSPVAPPASSLQGRRSAAASSGALASDAAASELTALQAAMLQVARARGVATGALSHIEALAETPLQGAMLAVAHARGVSTAAAPRTALQV